MENKHDNQPEELVNEAEKTAKEVTEDSAGEAEETVEETAEEWAEDVAETPGETAEDWTEDVAETVEETAEEAAEEVKEEAASAEETVPKKRKKGRIALLVIVIIIAALIAGAAVVWHQSYISVNGTPIHTMDKAQMEKEITDALHQNGFTFTDPAIDERLAKYSFDLSPITENFKDAVIERIQHKEYTIPINYDVAIGDVMNFVEEHNATCKKSKSAKYHPDTGKIDPEEYGERINLDRLLVVVRGKATQIDVTQFYNKPKITTESIEEALAYAQKLRDWTCTYKNGYTVTVPADAVKVNSKGQVSVNTDFLDGVMENLIDDFNSVGDPITFTTHSGKKIKLGSSYWGRVVDTARERIRLEQLLKEAEPVTDRSPCRNGHGQNYGDTYIEVSIADQHVWVYKDGKQIMDSACTTGKNGHSTPTGAFYILERVNGKWLVGDDYRSWVNKWMRITWDGVGLHDATWRGSFGGDYYRWGGSHGCINLPYSWACELYDKTYVDEPVFVYGYSQLEEAE